MNAAFFPPSLRARLALAGWAFYHRWRVQAGIPGWFLLDAAIPVLSTAMALLLGRAAGGPSAGQNFAANAGTAEYAAFLLVGSNVFLLSLRAMWDLGLWLRTQQVTGTLETLYTTPSNRAWIVAGLAAFNLARGLLNLVLSLLLGAALFQIPLAGRNYGMAVLFLAVGAVPLYGLSLLYGVLVLRFKETGALIQMAQAVLSLATGVFYPLALLPPLARALVLLLPNPWLAGGLRHALLNTPALLATWPADLAVLALMAVLTPALAFLALGRAERALRAGAGMGGF